VNFWFSPRRKILFSYVAKSAGHGKHGKREIKIGDCPLSCSSRINNKILSLSSGEFLSIRRFFSATPLAPRRNKYLTWFFFQPSALSLDPSLDRLLGPFLRRISSSRYLIFHRSGPCLVSTTSGNASLPPVGITYYLPFIPYHLPIRIDSLRSLSLFWLIFASTLSSCIFFIRPCWRSVRIIFIISLSALFFIWNSLHWNLARIYTYIIKM